jgi:hypothetical protein
VKNIFFLIVSLLLAAGLLVDPTLAVALSQPELILDRNYGAPGLTRPFAAQALAPELDTALFPPVLMRPKTLFQILHRLCLFRRQGDSASQERSGRNVSPAGPEKKGLADRYDKRALAAFGLTVLGVILWRLDQPDSVFMSRFFLVAASISSAFTIAVFLAGGVSMFLWGLKRYGIDWRASLWKGPVINLSVAVLAPIAVLSAIGFIGNIVDVWSVPWLIRHDIGYVLICVNFFFMGIVAVIQIAQTTLKAMDKDSDHHGHPPGDGKGGSHVVFIEGMNFNGYVETQIERLLTGPRTILHGLALANEIAGMPNEMPGSGIAAQGPFGISAAGMESPLNLVDSDPAAALESIRKALEGKAPTIAYLKDISERVRGLAEKAANDYPKVSLRARRLVSRVDSMILDREHPPEDVVRMIANGQKNAPTLLEIVPNLHRLFIPYHYLSRLKIAVDAVRLRPYASQEKKDALAQLRNQINHWLDQESVEQSRWPKGKASKRKPDRRVSAPRAPAAPAKAPSLAGRVYGPSERDLGAQINKINFTVKGKYAEGARPPIKEIYDAVIEELAKVSKRFAKPLENLKPFLDVRDRDAVKWAIQEATRKIDYLSGLRAIVIDLYDLALLGLKPDVPIVPLTGRSA